METAHHSGTIDKAAMAARSVQESIKSHSVFTYLFGDIEFNRHFISAMLLVWNVCLAGIAVYSGGMNSMIQLILLVFPTMALLTWIISVQPMRIVLSIASIATVIDIVIIAYNMLGA